MKIRVRPNSVFAHVFAAKLAVVTITVRQYAITYQFIICFSQNRGNPTILCHPFCPFHSSFFIHIRWAQLFPENISLSNFSFTTSRQLCAVYKKNIIQSHPNLAFLFWMLLYVLYCYRFNLIIKSPSFCQLKISLLNTSTSNCLPGSDFFLPVENDLIRLEKKWFAERTSLNKFL